MFTTFEGDNTVLLQLVAKGLLTGYRDAFGSLEGWGKVGFIADLVRETVLERTAARGLIARLVDAVPSRNDDEIPMLTRGWQLKMFEFREKHALEGAIRRLRKNSTTEGMAPFDMFNDVQDHVLQDGADAHRPRRPRGIRRRHRPDRRPGRQALLDKRLRPLRTVDDRGGQGLVPRTRPAHPDPRETPDQHGQPAAQGAATAHATLVDAFAIPHEWKAARILDEEAARQEAMAARDAAVGARAEGDSAPEESATDLEVAPAQ